MNYRILFLISFLTTTYAKGEVIDFISQTILERNCTKNLPVKDCSRFSKTLVKGLDVGIHHSNRSIVFFKKNLVKILNEPNIDDTLIALTNDINEGKLVNLWDETCSKVKITGMSCSSIIASLYQDIIARFVTTYENKNEQLEFLPTNWLALNRSISLFTVSYYKSLLEAIFKKVQSKIKNSRTNFNLYPSSFDEDIQRLNPENAYYFYISCYLSELLQSEFGNNTYSRLGGTYLSFLNKLGYFFLSVSKSNSNSNTPNRVSYFNYIDAMNADFREIRHMDLQDKKWSFRSTSVYLSYLGAKFQLNESFIKIDKFQRLLSISPYFLFRGISLGI